MYWKRRRNCRGEKQADNQRTKEWKAKARGSDEAKPEDEEKSRPTKEAAPSVIFDSGLEHRRRVGLEEEYAEADGRLQIGSGDDRYNHAGRARRGAIR